jgi:hypothetical protein
MLPFSIPAVNGTIAVTATSQAIALQGAGAVVLVQNVGSGECFIAVGDSTVTAVAAAATPATDATDGSMSVPPGVVASYSVPLSATHLAAVCATGGTTTLRVSRGEGA